MVKTLSSNPGGVGLIAGQGTKVPYAAWSGPKIIIIKLPLFLFNLRGLLRRCQGQLTRVSSSAGAWLLQVEAFCCKHTRGTALLVGILQCDCSLGHRKRIMLPTSSASALCSATFWPAPVGFCKFSKICDWTRSWTQYCAFGCMRIQAPTPVLWTPGGMGHRVAGFFGISLS